MKTLLLSCVLAMAAIPVLADSLTLTATVDGIVVGTASSANGTLDISDQAFGIFNLNSLSINSETFLAPPGVLNTNTLNVDQSISGNHILQLDIVASGLAGTPGIQQFLSEFSVTGLTTGWSAQETTTINGNLLSATPVFTVNSAAVDINGSALIGRTFTADAHYIIHSVGIGQFNGGIDINTTAAPVPGPIAGAGIPGLVSACFGLWAFAKRRRNRREDALSCG